MNKVFENPISLKEKIPPLSYYPFCEEDEKAYGTCHIALGNNIGFGGKVDVPLHIDCVIKKPTIFLDDKIIMKKGRLVPFQSVLVPTLSV